MSQLFAIFSANPNKPTDIGVKTKLSSAILLAEIGRLGTNRRTVVRRTLLGAI